MYNNKYSGAFSKRRYSNMATNKGLQTDPGSLDVARRFSVEASSADPNMGSVRVTVIDKVPSVNISTPTYEASPLSGVTTYLEGTVIEVKAEAKPGYRFVGWLTNINKSLKMGNPVRLTVDNDIVIRASFAPVQDQTRTINVDWDSSMGRVQSNGLQDGRISGITQGATVTLNANPNNGYHFVRWEGGPLNGTETTQHYVLQVNNDYNITAVFAADNDNTDEPESPHGGGGGTQPDTAHGKQTGSGLKAFVKKWWWAIAIVAIVVFKDRKGGAK